MGQQGSAYMPLRANCKKKSRWPGRLAFTARRPENRAVGNMAPPVKIASREHKIMRTMRVAAIAALLLVAGAAQAQQAPPASGVPPVPTRVKASTLANLCDQDRSACMTYVLGTADAMAGALVAAGRPQVFCIPPGTTNDALREAAYNHLRAHPEEGNSNAALVVLAGLVAAYPCG